MEDQKPGFAQLKLRLPTAVKEEVEAAALLSNRSMSAEIVARLQRYNTMQAQLNRLRSDVGALQAEVARRTAAMESMVDKVDHDRLRERFDGVKEDRDALREAMRQRQELENTLHMELAEAKGRASGIEKSFAAFMTAMSSEVIELKSPDKFVEAFQSALHSMGVTVTFPAAEGEEDPDVSS